MSLATYLQTRGRLIELSRTLGVSHSTVLRWAAGRVPAERVHAVCGATGLAPADLRPDLFRAPVLVGETQTAKVA